VVRIFDFGIDEGTKLPFLAMEYLKGESLEDLLERGGQMTERRAAGILSQVAKGLIEAHGRGIVHRDLKPDNINVRRLPSGEEFVKILDFGVAKMDRSGTNLTSTGTAVGTPSYMSPEQIQGRAVDFRSDLYALGCMLHDMLTGKPPFVDEEKSAIMVAHILKPAPPLPDKLPAGGTPTSSLVALYTSLMAKHVDKRPGSTKGVASTLDDLANGRQTPTLAPTQMGTPVPHIGGSDPADPSDLILAVSHHDLPADPESETAIAMPAHRTPLPDVTGTLPIIDAETAPRRPWWIAAVVALWLGAGAAYAMGVFDTKPAPEAADESAQVAPAATENAAEPEHSAVAETKHAAEPKPAPKVEAPPAAKPFPEPPTEPAKPEIEPEPKVEAPAPAPEIQPMEPSPWPKQVTVDSVPPEVNVLRDGQVIGRTPLEIDIPSEDAVVALVLTHPGYVKAKASMTADAMDPTVVRLKRRSSKRPARPAAKKPAMGVW